MQSLLEFDQRQLATTDAPLLIGVDEAGRGALAGPVVAGAVCLSPSCYVAPFVWPSDVPVNDSKQLSPSQREVIFADINQLKAKKILCAETGMASVREIEAYNILGATRLAMQRALEKVVQMFYVMPSFFHCDHKLNLSVSSGPTALLKKMLILIDGRPLRPFPHAHQAVVKGDSQSLAIALASVYAKVTRDSYMTALNEDYPHYGFAKHKGYGTVEHRKAIQTHGTLTLHRMHFLRKILPKEKQMLIENIVSK